MVHKLLISGVKLAVIINCFKSRLESYKWVPYQLKLLRKNACIVRVVFSKSR